MADSSGNSEPINSREVQQQSGPYSTLEVNSGQSGLYPALEVDPGISLPQTVTPPEKESYIDPFANAGRGPGSDPTQRTPKPYERLLPGKWLWLSVLVGIVLIGGIIGGIVGGRRSGQKQL
jgi:hypothetical protein